MGYDAKRMFVACGFRLGCRPVREARPWGGSLRILLSLAVLLAASLVARAQGPVSVEDRYRALAGSIDDRRIGTVVSTLSNAGSRVVGYPGERTAANWVRSRFEALFGKDQVSEETFEATVPMDRGATLRAGGRSFQIHAVWPNLVRTSQVPPEGLTGPLVYGGNGLLGAFAGKRIDGAIVLVDFNSGTDWLNAPRLGAKAVVFIEPDRTMRGEAEAKFVSIPLSIPRFYIGRSEAVALQAMALGRRPTEARIASKMAWERVPARNFIGVLPGRSKDPKVARQIIVVQAHYDGMSVVPALAPAAESAGGIAGLLETAEAFRKVGNERTLWFVATSGHFLGLQGIRELVAAHMDRWQVPGPFARLFGQAKDPEEPIHLWVGLDLASQTRSLGIFYKGHFVNVREDTQNLFSDIARVARENNEKVAAVLGYEAKKRFADGVNPVDGKTWRNYIPGKPAFDSEVVGMAGGFGVTFASIDDSRNQVDTPFDTADKVNPANLAIQLRTLVCLLQHYVNDPNDPSGDPRKQIPLYKSSQWTRMGLRSGFATVRGRVRDYDPRKSLVPSTPVPDALAVLPHVTGTKSFMGVRGNLVQLVSDGRAGISGEEGRGTFAFVGMPPTTADQQRHSVAAYHVDPATGDIDYAPDKGVSGADYPVEFAVTTGEKDVTVVVFPCVATSIYDLVDQQALRTLSTMTIYDGITNGEPRQYGFALSKPEPGVSYVEDTAVVFARRGDEFGGAAANPPPGATGGGSATDKLRQFKIVMGAGPGVTRFLLINSTKANPEGEGYVMGAGAGADAIDSSRSAAITHTALRVAKDMWNLDEFRIQRLLDNNIRNEGVLKLHALAKESIDKAEAALAALDYQTFDTYARAAWGYESRAYPDVTKTQQDVVNGVIFYLALMLPFAYFLERLLFGYSDLKRQLLASFLLFLGVFLVFALIHPAFRITLNAGIILLAFIMLALSALVTVLVWQKFEAQLKEQSKETSGTHSRDAGKGTIAVAAFALGVANMRRRKARTSLTCATLVLLTFTVLAFTSIVQDLRFNRVSAPGKPLHNGILLRDPNWNALQQVAYRLLDDEFGRSRLVAPRGWFLGTQPGEQTFLTLKRADREFGAKGTVGLSPQESQVSGIGEAVVAGRWFEPTDRLAIILPRKVADALRVADADVGSAKVSFSGQDYTVVGIVDQERLKQVLDLDQEPLTPVDFVQMQQLQKQGKADNSSGFQQYLHLDPEVVFFIPYQTLVNLGGDLRSVAIGYGDDSAAVLTDLQDNLMKRVDMNLYAASGGKIERFSSIAATSGAGMETVVVPILIAALIVLNTMLGSVYERVKEIHIFSSIGLSPANIGTLFMAEALVYAILGSVAGYVLGQAISKLLTVLGLLQGLSLNFSSISAVLSTLVIVAVVLLSTLWPAKKASEVATPAINRNWNVPDPDGDSWGIRLPFAVTGDQARGVNGFLAEWFRSYEGYSVGDFITEGIEEATFDSEHGLAYRIGCKAWLAPFDLGVSQHIRLETVPTDLEDVYDLRLTLMRVSGDVANWKRVNRRFLNTLRKQFLIWRTLSAGERERYLATEPVSGAAEAIS
ncbi:MAG: FtsX-like permease family protein [Armatimonadota bacterium]